jgi:hypothetical protein
MGHINTYFFENAQKISPKNMSLCAHHIFAYGSSTAVSLTGCRAQHGAKVLASGAPAWQPSGGAGAATGTRIAPGQAGELRRAARSSPGAGWFAGACPRGAPHSRSPPSLTSERKGFASKRKKGGEERHATESLNCIWGIF